MRGLGRRLGAISCVAVLFVAGTAMGAALRSRPQGEPRSSVPGNAGRFLDLTSDATGAPFADGNSSAQAHPISGDFTPAGWKIRPAGKQVNVLNFPLGLAPSHDASQVLVSSDNGGMQGISRIDAQSLEAAHSPAGNLFMGLAVTKDGRVYASGGNADRLFRYQLAGGQLVPLDATEAEPFPLHGILEGTVGRAAPQAMPLPVGDGIRVRGYPGNSVLDGRYLYVAGTLSEQAGPEKCSDRQKACARVSVVDTTTDTVVGRVPVGLDAYGLALDRKRHRLYVSNWADEAGRGRGRGTVSVVDVSKPTRPREIGWIRVGHHPTAVELTADGKRLFVANTNDDSMSILDVTSKLRVLRTESVRHAYGMPVGAHPDAFALSPDGKTLFVVLAGMNAVEVRDGVTGARVAGRPMYIPTGWYPSALLVTGTAKRYRLWVANAKGAGAAAKGTGYNLSVGQEIYPVDDGTVSIIDLPVPAATANEWTERVRRNDQLDRVKVDPCRPSGVRVSEVLCPPTGKRSPIKHVIYIITENKTFDQYFGDVDPARYDADPSFTLYGETVTPNHHALIDRFSLSDRFFSDAQVSVTGHSWTSGAIATDHNEKTWPADYDEGIRGSHGNGDPLRPGIGSESGEAIQEAEDELDDPEGGYIFEAFKRAGAVPPAKARPGKLSMAIYGESTARESGDMSAYQAPHWRDGDIQYFDTCRAQAFISGEAPMGPFTDAPDQFADCRGRKLPAAFNLAHWTKVLEETGRDVMPNFIYMTLPVNHTLGTNLGSPTPASMVADNDHAVGMVVDALSRSPFWASTVVMQTEDDTQAAGDHISPLRDYLQVIGPWAKPGPNHQWGSFPSLLRTIEQIFRVPPITLYDRLAYPQHGAFRTSLRERPDTRPYDAITPLVPYGLNRLGAPGQELSESMDWSTWDRIDMHLLNAILYAEARGTAFEWPEER